MFVAGGGCGGEASTGPAGFDRSTLGASLRVVVRVSQVIDGDTIDVAADGPTLTPDGRPLNDERVRLLGVDAPELGREACFAKAARTFVIDAVGQDTVELEFDGTRCRPPTDTRRCRGDYGRLLAYVRYRQPNGEWAVLNEALLSTGHAVVLRGPDRFRHRDSAWYDSLERVAARAGLGLWSCP